jgi:hypothetical protein
MDEELFRALVLRIVEKITSEIPNQTFGIPMLEAVIVGVLLEYEPEPALTIKLAKSLNRAVRAHLAQIRRACRGGYKAKLGHP